MAKTSKPKELTAFDDVKEFKVILKIMKKLKVDEIELFGVDGSIYFKTPKTEWFYITGQFLDLEKSKFFKLLSENNLSVKLDLELLSKISSTKKADALTVEINNKEYSLTTTEDSYKIVCLSSIYITDNFYTTSKDIIISSEVLEEFDNGEKIIEIHTKKLLVLIDTDSPVKVLYSDKIGLFRRVGIWVKNESLGVEMTQHFKTI